MVDHPPDAARFGSDYLGRAVVAAIGLGANTVSKALYPTTAQDSAGRLLHGRHAYELRFRSASCPRVFAFWSLTRCDQHILFYANPLNRYAIGDRTPGPEARSRCGLTIIVSHQEPGPAERSNWLPAPAGRFSLYLRLYEPWGSAQNNAWKPPAVVRTG